MGVKGVAQTGLRLPQAKAGAGVTTGIWLSPASLP